jgi:alkylated DNA repair dioxygenase AlkB
MEGLAEKETESAIQNQEVPIPIKKIVHDVVEGLTIVEDSIDREYHDQLVRHVGEGEWDTTLSRRVQHYGYRYDYKNRNLEKGSAPPLPEWSIKLCEHLKQKGLIDKIPDQLIINEYKVGQRISKHTDAKVFGPVIFSISLGSHCTMNFGNRSETVSFRVNNCTFLKMEGDARYKWTHDISPITIAKRYSLTFRYVDQN